VGEGGWRPAASRGRDADRDPEREPERERERDRERERERDLERDLGVRWLAPPLLDIEAGVVVAVEVEVEVGGLDGDAGGPDTPPPRGCCDGW